MENKELEEARVVYKIAPEWLKNTLELKFGKELLEGKLEITKKEFHYTDIKTLQDAELRTGLKLVINESDTEDEIAYKSLKIIIKAINPTGYAPDFTDRDEKKWYPWFDLSVASGFGFNATDCHYRSASSGCGPWSCFSDQERCKYTATTFLDLYGKWVKGN